MTFFVKYDNLYVGNADGKFIADIGNIFGFPRPAALKGFTGVLPVEFQAAAEAFVNASNQPQPQPVVDTVSKVRNDLEAELKAHGIFFRGADRGAGGSWVKAHDVGLGGDSIRDAGDSSFRFETVLSIDDFNAELAQRLSGASWKWL